MKEWTVMVYMAGDNNLSEDMIRAIVELRRTIHATGSRIAGAMSEMKVAPEKNKQNGISLLVEFDGEHPTVPTMRYDLTFDTANPGSYLGSSNPVNVDPNPKIPTNRPGNPQPGLVESRISDFVQYCIDTRPAKKYALILSGHTDAFLGKTLLFDQEPSGVATIQGIQEVIARKFPRKLDIFAFDGCVMNSLEVAYEFRNNVKTWIASQGSIPNYTWDYARIAEQLMELDESQLDSTTIVDAVIQSVKDYNCPFAFGGRSVDISALNLENMEDFSQDLDNAAKIMTLLLFLFPWNSVIGSKILEVFLQAHWNCQSAMFDQAIDLPDFLSRLEVECSKFVRQTYGIDQTNSAGLLNENPLVEDELVKIIHSNLDKSPTPGMVLAVIQFGVKRLRDSLTGREIIKKGVFVGAEYRYCNGISIFFPWSYVALWMAKAGYEKLSFTTAHPGLYTLITTLVAMTARPQMTLRSGMPEVSKAIEQMLAYFGHLFPVLKTSAEEIKKIEFLDIFTLDLAKTLIVDALDTKLSPPYNKGMDSYVFHFGKTSNINPILDITGDFPPRTEHGQCPEFRKC